jgi:formate hydrogenlyase subunit 6/NADH:ubiquinone oxidoreductase subunit I
MEIIKKIIKKESLAKLFEKLKASGKTIYAPVVKDQKTIFKRNADFKEITFDHIQTVESVKNMVFPKVENLIFYHTDKDGVVMKDIDWSKIPETVLWGAHPCDAAGFGELKSIFMWDSHDEIFNARLQKLTVIGFSCFKSDEDCFCTSVGLNPGSTLGSDILLTKLNEQSYLAEIITEKGNAILSSAPELFEDAKEVKKEETLAKVAQKFDHQLVTKKLATSFNHPFWIENSLRCIGCGACAYVCPACACFDIQDETKGKNGKRLRCWDSCGLSLFTVHTSGHNPREVQSQRWRQRIMHKFSYMPERNQSLGCVGCGRCSRACPVDMNILEQLVELERIA